MLTVPTFTVKSTIHVGKHTSPMDPFGYNTILININRFHQQLSYLGVSKNRGKTPKWMVYNGKPYLKWMIWGGFTTPIFGNT